MAGSFYKITRKPQPVALIESRVGVASRRGSFFPPQLLKRLHLGYYSQHFSTIELNGIFYRTPTIQGGARFG
jgi:uncharacterized protein YecE (DUF72 family)